MSRLYRDRADVTQGTAGVVKVEGKQRNGLSDRNASINEAMDIGNSATSVEAWEKRRGRKENQAYPASGNG